MLAGAGCSLFLPLDGFLDDGSFTAVEAGSDAGELDVMGGEGASASDAESDELFDAGVLGMDASRIYVFGGGTTTVVSSQLTEGTTLYSDVDADGGLGPWQEGPALPSPRMSAPAVLGSDFVLLAGGAVAGNTARANVTVGRIGSGEVTSYFESTPVLSPGRQQAGVARSGNKAIVFGGIIADGSAERSILTGIVGPNSVESFVRTGDLPFPLARMAVAQSATHLFVVGGLDGNSKRRNTILVAKFTPEGISSFEASDKTLPVLTTHARAVFYRNSLIVVGGDSEQNGNMNQVLVFQVSPQGELGNPTSTTNVPVGVSRHAVVVVRDRIYVIGGRTAGNVSTSDVYVGDLTPEGFVTTWQATAPLPGPRLFHSVIAL